MRQPARPMPQTSRFQAMVAPTAGLVLDQPVAKPAKNAAEVMENFIPTDRGARVRGGLRASALVDGPVTSLFTYDAGALSRFFAATEKGVFDVSGLNPNKAALGGGFIGQTAGYYSTAQIGTVGGQFLYAVNGADPAWVYDGTEWTPAGVGTNELEFAWLSADLVVGQTITGGTSGATASIVGINLTGEASGRLILGAITGGPFTSGETVTATGAGFGRNLWTYSEELNQAVWTKTGATITANATSGPDGSATADKIVESVGGFLGHFVSRNLTVTAGETYTLSCYAKAAERQHLQLVFQSGQFGSTIVAGFDLTGDGAVMIGSVGSARIEAVGSGWYRCVLTGTCVTAGTTQPQIRMATSLSTTPDNYSGNGTSGLHVWGAQIEVGGFSTRYEFTGAALATNTQITATTNSASFTAITFTGVSTSDLSAVWLYRNRLFFVEKDTLKAWYLPVDSIGGAAQSVSLAGVFQRGGSLLFGATWSLDSGDGLDDKCVFVSTNGEVAIYEGADPSDAATWNLVGRYDIGRPLGINGTMQAGGDLLIATVDGIVPLSQVIVKDPAALSLAAVTRAVEPLWKRETGSTVAQIELLKWTDQGLGLVTLPDSDKCLIVNLQSGAWATATGWTANTAAIFVGKAYIGRDDGRVLAIDDGGIDYDLPFTARLCMAFQDFGDPLSYKQGTLMRAVYFAPEPVTMKFSVASDYQPSFPVAPIAENVTAASDYLVWDVGNWDEGLWWSEAVEEAVQTFTTQWRTVRGQGTALAPCVQITSGAATKINCEIARIDMAYERGRAVA